MLSLSIKVNVVAATGGDGFYGDKEAKNSQLCMPTSFVTGGSDHKLTSTDWLIVTHESKSYQKVKLLMLCNILMQY